MLREAEKKELMDGGGRGNDDNTNNGCYGGTAFGRRRGGKLGQSGTMKDDDIWTMAVWRGTTIDEDKKPHERAGRKKVDSPAETAVD
jgi:hypothetical protein